VDVVVDGRGLPLGNYLHSASPAEVKLAETTLAAIRGRTESYCGPSSAEADAGDRRQKRTTAIRCEKRCSVAGSSHLPHKEEPRSAGDADARALSVTEGDGSGAHQRLAGKLRRLVVRYDRSLTIYGAFFHIACL